MVNLKTKSGRMVPLSVLIVPDITVSLRIITNECVSQLPYLKGLPLAQPVTTHENFKISLLIDADHYWDIVEDDIIRGDGPTAIGSKLGYLLSGPLPFTQFTIILHVGAVNTINCDLKIFRPWKQLVQNHKRKTAQTQIKSSSRHTHRTTSHA